IVLRSTLRNAGIHANVIHATDLEEAFEQARKHDPHVTVVERGDQSLAIAEAMLADAASPFADRAVIVVLDKLEKELVQKLIELGVRDVVPSDFEVQLQHAIVREARAEQQARELDDLRQLLRSAEGRCQKLIDGSSEPVTYVQDGLHIYANKPYLELMGFESQTDLVDQPLLDYVASDDAARMRDFLKRGEGVEDFNLVTAEGKTVAATLSAMRATFDGEECIQLFVTKKVDESALEEQMQLLTQRDLLTGLYNRNYLFDQVQERLEELRGGNMEEQAALLHIEVMNIEEMRKHLGTTGIDSFLIEYGKAIDQIIGEAGQVARHGAYSFLILVNSTDSASAQRLAERLASHANKFVFSMEQASIAAHIAIGVILIDGDSPNVMELVHRVEQAAHKAAEKGRNQFEFYRPDEKSASEQELKEAWARRLRSALKDNRFFMVYQPVVSLAEDRERPRYEVFLRMLDEDGQELSPLNFIVQAERTDLIESIDRWLILSSLKRIHDGIKKGEYLQLFIRVSVQSLQKPEFVAWLKKTLSAVKLPQTLLFMQVAAGDAGYLIKQLNDLQQAVSGLGCDILIDGFGESRDEQTLLSYIRPAFIKVSRALMSGFATNTRSQEVVKDLVEFAQEKQIKVICPNVEDAATLQMLWGMGVDFVQGNFIQGVSDKTDFDFKSL
ncbi:MAG TPA: EAL domain-containing protein, partial [Halothiobacillus sp.]|nr:EAL domain-containing protein [Halothiobacillus sp.]